MKNITKVAIALAFCVAISAETQAATRTNINPSVTLAWTAPPVSTNYTVVGYNVYMGTATGNYSSVVYVAGVGTTTVTVTNGLVRGARYYFAATSVGSTGLESVYSNEVSAVIPVLPVAPVLQAPVVQ
jgi:hypothetical protein